MRVKWLRTLGVEKIFVTDILDDSLRIASRVGACVTLNPSEVDVAKEEQKLVGDGATQLSQAFTIAVRDVLSKDSELVDPRKYLTEGRSAQIEIVRERIRFLVLLVRQVNSYDPVLEPECRH